MRLKCATSWKQCLLFWLCVAPSQRRSEVIGKCPASQFDTSHTSGQFRSPVWLWVFKWLVHLQQYGTCTTSIHSLDSIPAWYRGLSLELIMVKNIHFGRNNWLFSLMLGRNHGLRLMVESLHQVCFSWKPAFPRLHPLHFPPCYPRLVSCDPDPPLLTDAWCFTFNSCVFRFQNWRLQQGKLKHQTTVTCTIAATSPVSNTASKH